MENINKDIDAIVSLEKKESELTYNYIKINKNDVLGESAKSVLLKPKNGAFTLWLTKSYILPSNYSNIMSLTVVNEYIYDVLLENGETQKINGTLLLNTLKKCYSAINFEARAKAKAKNNILG